jgi:hypothetical protein
MGYFDDLPDSSPNTGAFDTLPETSPDTGAFDKLPNEEVQTKSPGYKDMFYAGLSNSIHGLQKAQATTGRLPAPVPESDSWLKRRTADLGTLLGDIDTFAVSGAAGAIPGASVGSAIFPGVGSAIGGALTGLPTSMATVSAYRKSLQSQLAGGEDITGMDVLKEAGKGGLVGLSMVPFSLAGAPAIAPTFAKSLPIASKILAPSGAIVAGAGTQATLEGQPLTMEEISAFAFPMIGAHAGMKASRGIGQYKEYITNKNKAANKDIQIAKNKAILADPNATTEAKEAAKVALKVNLAPVDVETLITPKVAVGPSLSKSEERRRKKIQEVVDNINKLKDEQTNAGDLRQKSLNQESDPLVTIDSTEGNIERLDYNSKAMIRSRAKELGSVEEVAKVFSTDSPADIWARAYAEKIYKPKEVVDEKGNLEDLNLFGNEEEPNKPFVQKLSKGEITEE